MINNDIWFYGKRNRFELILYNLEILVGICVKI